MHISSLLTWQNNGQLTPETDHSNPGYGTTDSFLYSLFPSGKYILLGVYMHFLISMCYEPIHLVFHLNEVHFSAIWCINRRIRVRDNFTSLETVEDFLYAIHPLARHRKHVYKHWMDDDGLSLAICLSNTNT